MSGRGASIAATVAGGIVLALAIAARADDARLVPLSDFAPALLVLRDLAGNEHALADYRGRVVLVNFWASWCDPCRAEMPSMQKLREELAGRRFSILAVNYGESRARVADFVKRAAVGFPVLLDPDQETARAWRVRVLPVSFVVGADGSVKYRAVGEVDWTSPAIADAVRRLLP
jgi:thiol-disulfide isomerase/thioredoxin